MRLTASVLFNSPAVLGYVANVVCFLTLYFLCHIKNYCNEKPNIRVQSKVINYLYDLQYFNVFIFMDILSHSFATHGHLPKNPFKIT